MLWHSYNKERMSLVLHRWSAGWFSWYTECVLSYPPSSSPDRGTPCRSRFGTRMKRRQRNTGRNVVLDGLLTRRECPGTRCDPAGWSVQPTPWPRETRNTQPSGSPSANKHTWLTRRPQAGNNRNQWTQHTAGTTSDEECSHHNEVQQRRAFLETNYFDGIKIGFIICSVCCDRNSPSVICPQFSAEHHPVPLVKGHCRTTAIVPYHKYTRMLFFNFSIVTIATYRWTDLFKGSVYAHKYSQKIWK